MISSTNKIKQRFKAGEIVRVRVMEFLGDHAWIVSLDGMLIQVRNKSRREFQEDDFIKVKIESVDPAVLTVI